MVLVRRHRSATDFSNFTKRGTQNFESSSRPRVVLEDTGLKVKEYLGFKVLVGKEGNSFYGLRFGNSFRCGDLVLRSKFNDNGNGNGNGGEVL